MSAFKPFIDGWVAAKDLPKPSALVGVPPQLQLNGFHLRQVEEMPFVEDKPVDVQQLHEDSTLAGHVFFYPNFRLPFPPRDNANLSCAGIEKFIRENPTMPIVRNNSNGDEIPHLVLASLVAKPLDECTPEELDETYYATIGGFPVICLYTIGADNHSTAFKHATHFKNGVQFEGVDILDWDMVTFEEDYFKRPAGEVLTHARVYKNIYERLFNMDSIDLGF